MSAFQHLSVSAFLEPRSSGPCATWWASSAATAPANPPCSKSSVASPSRPPGAGNFSVAAFRISAFSPSALASIRNLAGTKSPSAAARLGDQHDKRTLGSRFDASLDFRQIGGMTTALEQITQEALQLPRQQRLALAGFLLELDEASDDPQVEAAWEQELRTRIQAVDDGTAVGIPYAEAMREAQNHLPP